MNIIIKFLLGFFAYGIPILAISTEIKLHYGINLIDLNNDGIEDIVLKSRFDLTNLSAVDMLTVYIQGNDDSVHLVPSTYANSTNLYSTQIKGTEITISDFKFVMNKEQVILLNLEKIGNHLTQATPIRISSYLLSERKNSKSTQYQWDISSYCVTTSFYMSVEEALMDECLDKLIND